MKNCLLPKWLCLLFVGLWLCPVAYSEDNSTVLNVYYLYGNPRCPSCKKIENYTQKAIEQNFSKEIASGEIVFQTVNTDLKENQHYIKDYGLYTKSVVLSLSQADKEVAFKNLEKVWTLLMNEKAFLDYIRDEVNKMREDVA